MAKEALKIFLRSLSLGSWFNIISFGNEFEFLFNESVEYNEENLKKATA
jgi:hypothetical protein